MTETAEDAYFYNDLPLSFDKSWQILADGAAHRKGAAHAPVVATVDRLGNPSQRIMILRHADRQRRSLRFHTDSRSNKMMEIGLGARASVLVYDAAEKIQLRLGGIARTEIYGVTADSAWDSSTLFARRCYMAENAPGHDSEHPTSGLPHWIEGKMPAHADIAEARQNFAIIGIKIDEVEWLYLANSGHRRARWNWSSDQWSGRWLIP
jgi:pyridoxamine 5'-phosphate oxidase